MSSFSAEALEAACRVAPRLQYGVLFEEVPADWRQSLARFGAISLHCAAEAASDAVLREAAQAGIPVLCYTVNDPADAQALLDRGVTSVFTDRLDLFS